MKLGNIPTVGAILVIAFVIALVFSQFSPIMVPAAPGKVVTGGCVGTARDAEGGCIEIRELLPREPITRTTTTTCVGDACKPPTTTTTTTASQTTTTTASETTTTTTSQTTTTTTTTTAAPSFTFSNFACHAKTGSIAGYDCSLTYNNALGEDAAIVFVISDSQQITLSSVVYTAPQGSGTASDTYFCTSSGNYYMSWQAYRASDTNFQNEVGFSTPGQAQLMQCS